MSGEGQSFLLPPSGLDQIANIEDWSNTDVPGLWIYRVGPLDLLGNVEGPNKGVSQGKSNVKMSTYIDFFVLVAFPVEAFC